MLRLQFDLVKSIFNYCAMQDVRNFAMTSKDNRVLVKRYKLTQDYLNSSVFCLFGRGAITHKINGIIDFCHRSKYFEYNEIKKLSCSYVTTMVEEVVYGAATMIMPRSTHSHYCYKCEEMQKYSFMFNDQDLLNYIFHDKIIDTHTFTGYESLSLYIPLTIQALMAIQSLLLLNKYLYKRESQYGKGQFYITYNNQTQSLEASISNARITFKVNDILMFFGEHNKKMLERSKDLATQYLYETARI